MLKLIFIVLGELANGEVTIAFEFADRLPADKYDVHFLIPEKSKPILDDKGMKNFALDIWKEPEENKKIIDEFIENIQPAFFVVSDVFTMEYAQVWSGLNFDGLKEYGVKIIGIDEFDYLDAGYCVDYYGGIDRSLPPLLDRCDYIVRSCPLSAVRPQHDKVKYFSLYKEKLTIAQEEKQRIRQQLNMAEDEKMILIVLSRWETINIYRLPALGAFLKWMPILLQNYIRSLNKKVTLVHVSPIRWPEVDKNLINYHYFSYLPPASYDTFLLSSDLFLTFNLVSVTLAKATFGAIPSMVFQNYKHIDFTQLADRLKQLPDWYREMAEDVKIAYPFKASVFGWSKLLNTVFGDNEYTRTFVQVPFFKMAETVSAFDRYLFDPIAIEELKKRQWAYAEKMLGLDTPDEIITSFANESR